MILDFIYALCASVGFAVLFNIPRKETIYTGIAGGIGWVIYNKLLLLNVSAIFASFVGALIVGIIAELLAKFRKKPATIFVIPGIITLVPGYGLYFSMLKIIEEDYTEAGRVGFETLLIAVVIASAIIIASSFGKVLRKIEKTNEKLT